MNPTLEMTRHAECRSQQRGIPPIAVDLLLQFGRREQAGDGACRVFLDKSSRKKLRAYVGPLVSALDTHLDIYAIVASDERVITVAHRLELLQRT
jgi:hypothetical protein